ncbi:MAG: VOC family protein [Pseudomonadota bacterium]
MKINPYLNFDGNAAEALAFYAETLGGTVASSMTFGAMPDQPDWVTDANRDRLANAVLNVGDNVILLSDTAGFEPHKGFAGVTLQMSLPDMDQGQVVFDKLSAGGAVRMPFAPTFWAKGFGMCHDKFGVGWMVNVE